MNHLDGPDGGSHDAAPPGSDTLLPLVYDPDAGQVFWLSADRRILSSPVDTDGHLSLAAATPSPLPGDDERFEVVRTLLDDIATYTCRPLRLPIAAPDPDGYDEYAVVWVDNSYYAATPREAAEQAWKTMRLPRSHACVFQVVNRRTGQRVEVDLLDDEPDSTGGGAGQRDSWGSQP